MNKFFHKYGVFFELGIIIVLTRWFFNMSGYEPNEVIFAVVASIFVPLFLYLDLYEKFSKKED